MNPSTSSGQAELLAELAAMGRLVERLAKQIERLAAHCEAGPGKSGPGLARRGMARQGAVCRGRDDEDDGSD